MLRTHEQPASEAGATLPHHAIDDAEGFDVPRCNAQEKPGAGFVLDLDSPTRRSCRFVVAEAIDPLLGQSFAVQALHYCSPGECWGSAEPRFSRARVRTGSDPIVQHDQAIDKAGLYSWLPVCAGELNLASSQLRFDLPDHRRP